MPPWRGTPFRSSGAICWEPSSQPCSQPGPYLCCCGCPCVALLLCIVSTGASLEPSTMHWCDTLPDCSSAGGREGEIELPPLCVFPSLDHAAAAEKLHPPGMPLKSTRVRVASASCLLQGQGVAPLPAVQPAHLNPSVRLHAVQAFRYVQGGGSLLACRDAGAPAAPCEQQRAGSFPPAVSGGCWHQTHRCKGLSCCGALIWPQCAEETMPWLCMRSLLLTLTRSRWHG